MPATLSFRVPNPQSSKRAINKKTEANPNSLNPIHPEHTEEVIIQVERHAYSMIKYTKMVTSVTFK